MTLNTLGTLCKMGLDGDELGEATHQHFQVLHLHHGPQKPSSEQGVLAPGFQYQQTS